MDGDTLMNDKVIAIIKAAEEVTHQMEHFEVNVRDAIDVTYAGIRLDNAVEDYKKTVFSAYDHVH
jgi:hypothetical protein